MCLSSVWQCINWRLHYCVIIGNQKRKRRERGIRAVKERRKLWARKGFKYDAIYIYIIYILYVYILNIYIYTHTYIHTNFILYILHNHEIVSTRTTYLYCNIMMRCWSRHISILLRFTNACKYFCTFCVCWVLRDLDARRERSAGKDNGRITEKCRISPCLSRLSWNSWRGLNVELWQNSHLGNRIDAAFLYCHDVISWLIDWFNETFLFATRSLL